METSKLYKLDSKGKTRVWYAEKAGTSYTTYAGLLDGKLISNVYTPKAKGKNSLCEQVFKDMKSKERKKHERELYSYDLSKPHPLAFIQPMLALDATKVPKRIDWANSKYTTQPKLNGVRCIAELKENKVILTSRKGKQYNVPHVQAELLDLMNDPAWPPGVPADGELYIHGVELGDITHAVANAEEHPNLEYRIFDVACNQNFALRYEALDSISFAPYATLDIVPCTPVVSMDDLKAIHDIHERNGFEGVMLRDMKAKYQFGQKNPALFKYKTFQDSEFEIVGAKQDKHGGMVFRLSTVEGVGFDSRPMGTDEYRAELWSQRNSLLGKMVTVRYSTLLASGAPEFNRTLYKQGSLIRDYE